MRKDEHGQPCPETLGEYRDLCEAFARMARLEGTSEAVQFLDTRILVAQHGRDEVVVAPDSQMREILMPMLLNQARPDFGPVKGVIELPPSSEEEVWGCNRCLEPKLTRGGLCDDCRREP